MILYYGLTNYHLLCSILHRLFFCPNDEAIFVASEGNLKDRFSSLKNTGFFNDCYYIEDKKLRDEKLNFLLGKDDEQSKIEKVAKEYAKEYEKILPFDIKTFDNLYICADHGALGLYILINNLNFNYIEDAKGIYTNWENLARIIEIKDLGMHILSMFYGAYGKSKLIKEKFVAFKSQKEGYNLDDCINFEINDLLDKLSKENLQKIFDLFGLKKIDSKTVNKTALILTQRFQTYKLIEENQMSYMYALLCDIFAPDCKVLLKAHPGDKTDYTQNFSNEFIIDRLIPSELLRFVIDRNFDVGICTYSSSIKSLDKYINTIYNIDETIVNSKDNIFKIYYLFELAKKFNCTLNIKNDSLIECFNKLYNLNGTKSIIYGETADENSNIVIKDFPFYKANVKVTIAKNSPGGSSYDFLYIKADEKDTEELMKFNFDTVFKLSNTHLSISSSNAVVMEYQENKN